MADTTSRLTFGVDDPAPIDRLGRRPFADRLARLVLQWKGQSSLVIGLFGPWGSGKTTVKNQVVARLEQEPKKQRPFIIHFNPWEWSGPEQLREAFFDQLAVELKGKKSERANEAAERLSRYGTMLTLGSSVAESLKVLGPLLVPGSGLLFDGLQKILKQGGDLVNGAGAVPRPSLREVKADLAEAMSKIGRNVVVIVDDVDRLTSAEVAQLFALLKVNADFPRMVYLVLCDPTAVAAALDHVVDARGEKYLEKIVQVGFHLPHVSADQLERVLTEDVRKLLRSSKLDHLFEEPRWANVCADGLMDYFQTMRDVNRYVANCEFTISLLHEDGVHFDIIDFLLLEVWRMFERSLYEELPRQKEFLTGRARWRSEGDADAFVERLLRSAAEERRESARALLVALFGMGTKNDRSRYDTARRRNAAVRDFQTFDRYFYFSAPQHEFRGPELAEIIESRSDRELFHAHLRNALATGRLPQLMSELSAQALPPNVTAYVCALVDFADQVPAELQSADVGSIASAVNRSVWTALEHVDAEQRAAIVEAVRVETSGLLVLTTLAPVDSRDGVASLTNEVDAEAIAVELERRIGSGDGITDHAHFAYVLDWWHERRPEAAAQFVRKMLSEDETALRLLRAYAPRTLINVGRVRIRQGGTRVAYDALVEVVLPDLVRKTVERLRRASHLAIEDRQLVDEWFDRLATRTS